MNNVADRSEQQCTLSAANFTNSEQQLNIRPPSVPTAPYLPSKRTIDTIANSPQLEIPELQADGEKGHPPLLSSDRYASNVPPLLPQDQRDPSARRIRGSCRLSPGRRSCRKCSRPCPHGISPGRDSRPNISRRPERASENSTTMAVSRAYVFTSRRG